MWQQLEPATVALGTAAHGAAELSGLQSCGEEENIHRGHFYKIHMYEYTSSACFVYAQCPCNHRAYREGADMKKEAKHSSQ